MTNHTPPSSQPRRFASLARLAALVAIALLFSACSSGDDSAAPSSIGFDDPNTATTDVPTTEAAETEPAAPVPAESSTTTVASTVPTTEPTAPEPVITYDEDETVGALHVQNVSSDDVLNIRSGPGVANDIVGTLAPDAWHVESTSNIATVDGVLWREVEKGDGTIGYVHANYVAFNDITCADVFVSDATIGTHQTTGDIDGDSLMDTMELLVGNSDVHLEIAFGNGATMRRPIGETSEDALLGFGGYAISTVDIDGNGRDEVRIDTSAGRWTGTTFYRPSEDCSLPAYGNGGSVFRLGSYGSAGSPIFWNCEAFGTPDAKIIKIVGSQETGEMIFTFTTYGFDINDGFVSVPGYPEHTMTTEEFSTYSSTGTCA